MNESTFFMGGDSWTRDILSSNLLSILIIFILSVEFSIVDYCQYPVKPSNLIVPHSQMPWAPALNEHYGRIIREQRANGYLLDGFLVLHVPEPYDKRSVR